MWAVVRSLLHELMLKNSSSPTGTQHGLFLLCMSGPKYGHKYAGKYLQVMTCLATSNHVACLDDHELKASMQMHMRCKHSVMPKFAKRQELRVSAVSKSCAWCLPGLMRILSPRQASCDAHHRTNASPSCSHQSPESWIAHAAVSEWNARNQCHHRPPDPEQLSGL